MLEASLVILNADVVTLNSKQPKAAAIAVRDEKIVDVGSNQQIRKHVGKKARVINAKGRTVVPGFVDCHIHMTGFGFSLQYLNLRNVKSVKQLQQKLKKYAKDYPEKEWILGGQWDHEKFREKRYPTRWDLDEAVSDKPVFLRRVCGHVAVANTKALQMAGITAETVVEGGKIDLDAKTNQPNGLLREKAVELVEKRIPQPKTQDLEAACLLACEKAVENGLTCVHWLVESREELHVLQKLCFEGKLPLRVYVGIAAKQLENLAKLGVQTGFGNDLLKIGFVKIFADGSLGAHTAALKEPYFDKPETCGILLQTHEKLEELVSKANSAGLQLGIHAIGDRAVEAALKAYEKAQKDNPENTLRHRIEHCSVLNPKLIMQMKRLGIIASVQPHFVISDFWVTSRVGKSRARWVYPFKTLIREGITVVSGSDCPVEPPSPLLGIWAAAARKSFPEESLTAEEALKTYTVNAAFASFDENNRGTIEAGKLADLVMLSDNPLKTKRDNIRKIKVEMTIVDGKIVYEKRI